MSNVQKYVRHSKVGFVLWPTTDDLWHKHIGHLLLMRGGGEILSAGFATVFDGDVCCYGESESLKIKSMPGDSEALAKQLGLATPGTAGAPK